MTISMILTLTLTLDSDPDTDPCIAFGIPGKVLGSQEVTPRWRMAGWVVDIGKKIIGKLEPIFVYVNIFG